MFSVPLTPALRSRSSLTVASDSSIICLALYESTFPASVTWNLRVVLSTSFTPNSLSSCLSCWLR